MKYLFIIILLMGCEDSYNEPESNSDSEVQTEPDLVLQSMKVACETNNSVFDYEYLGGVYDKMVTYTACRSLFIRMFRLLTDDPICPMEERLDGDDYDMYHDYKDKCWDLYDQ